MVAGYASCGIPHMLRASSISSGVVSSVKRGSQQYGLAMLDSKLKNDQRALEIKMAAHLTCTLIHVAYACALSLDYMHATPIT